MICFYLRSFFVATPGAAAGAAVRYYFVQIYPRIYGPFVLKFMLFERLR